MFASACAVARAYPLYTRKTRGSDDNNSDNVIVNVEFILIENDMIVLGNSLIESDIECLTDAANGIRLAARIVDMPCNEMNVDGFIDEINAIANVLNVKSTIIRGEELNERGFGGIYGVGKAATVPPALAVLSYEPSGAKETYAWVGKGMRQKRKNSGRITNMLPVTLVRKSSAQKYSIRFHLRETRQISIKIVFQLCLESHVD